MIASALVSEPHLLMLDEPASGLTKPEIEQLDALLVAINRTGVTVLLIEHVLSLLLSVSERLIVLNQGKVLAEGTPDEVVSNPAVITAYLGGRTS
jgi:branched-chain amino acid transport system ATP-binding protein